MRLLLIRHGQTPNNVTGALDTAVPGAGLTALGRLQAAAVPEALTGEPIAAIYISTLTRTLLTAAPLAAARQLDPEVRAGLEEISAADLEMRSDPAAIEGYVDCLVAWMHRDLARPMPGGPTGHDFLDRYGAAISTIAAAHGRDDTAVVFSHGAAIRVYTSLAADLDPAQAVELSIANTGMAVLDGEPGAWHLRHWRSDPLGGARLLDQHAHDVTGESADDVTDDETP